jgi:hypothetical protein
MKKTRWKSQEDSVEFLACKTSQFYSFFFITDGSGFEPLYLPNKGRYRTRQCCGSDQDLYVFGPPRSGSGLIGTRYGSGFGSGSLNIIKQENLGSYCFVTSLWLVVFKSTGNQQKNLEKNVITILKVTDENTRIRVRIRIR